MNRRSMNCLVIATLLCGNACTVQEPLEAVSQYVVDFSGDWELNDALSDRISERSRSMLAAAARQRQQEADLGIARRGATVDIGNAPFGAYEAVMGLGWLTEMIAQATVLNIAQGGQRIVIDRDEDYDLVCDWGAAPDESKLGAQSCGWHEEQLAFRIQLPEGLTVHHVLTLARSRDRLALTTTVYSKRARMPFTLNRVYTRYVPAEELYDCEYTIASQTTCHLGTQDP